MYTTIRCKPPLANPEFWPKQGGGGTTIWHHKQNIREKSRHASRAEFCENNGGYSGGGVCITPDSLGWPKTVGTPHNVAPRGLAVSWWNHVGPKWQNPPDLQYLVAF